MAKALEELLAENEELSRQRVALQRRRRALWEKINPLLEEAEAERLANPTRTAPPQRVG